jgi:hypothetical protein
MTSATTQPARSTGGRHVEGHGLVLFASVTLVIIGRVNLIYGTAAMRTAARRTAALRDGQQVRGAGRQLRCGESHLARKHLA